MFDKMDPEKKAQFAAFVQAISIGVGEYLHQHPPQIPQPQPRPQYQPVEVLRVRTDGVKYRQQTSVPQLLAEICDCLQLLQEIAIDFDEDQYVAATKKRRRK